MADEMVFGVRITGDPGGAVKAVDQVVSAARKLDAKLKSMANRVISGTVGQPTPLQNVDQIGNSKDITAWQARQEMELARQRMASAKQHYLNLRAAADAYYKKVIAQEQKVAQIRKKLSENQAAGKGTSRLTQSLGKQEQVLAGMRATYIKSYETKAAKAEQAVYNATVSFARKATQVVKQEKAAQEAAAKKAADKQVQHFRKLDAEAKRLSKSVGQGAMQGINSIITSLGSAGNSFRLITQGLSELGRVLTNYIAIPLGGLFFYATKTAIDFEAAIVRVGKTTGLEGAKLQQLTNFIREFALTTVSSQTELATFAEQLGQLGVTDTNAMARLIATVEMMASATELSADEVTKSMGRIATAFGYDLNTETGVRSVEKLSNAINKLENTTAASAGEIIEGLLNVASVGGMLDIPVQDMAAIVAQMESMGVASDAVGNRITRFYQQLITKSDEAAKFMSGFTTEIVKDGERIKRTYSGDADEFMAWLNEDKTQVLTDFMAALSQVPGDQSTQAMAQWFELVGQVGGKVGVLAGNVKGLGEALKNSREEFEKGNSLFVEYDKALMTTESHLKIMRNNINEAAITVGDAFLPVLTRLIEYAIPGIQILTNAFKSLSWNTKLLIVGLPLIAMVLAPLLFIISQIGHAFGMLFMGFQTFFVLSKNVGMAVFGMGKALFSAAKLLRVLAAGGTLAAGALSGTLAPAILTVVGALAGIGAIGGVAFAALKALQSRGVDIAGFFNNLAERAKNWGENMMVTYANGLLGGAAKFVSKAISTIASWIANFFEAHSPPKEGPLSDIDKWGGPLFTSFLRGFYLADFSILEDVGNTIRSILQNLFTDEDSGGAIQGMVGAAREALAELIDVFNKTGEISQALLDEVVANAGHLAEDVQQLVTLWLEYEATQRRIKELEEERQKVEQDYGDEIAAIAASNLSAEEKAAKIREAIARKNTQVDAIEDQIDAEEEKGDALKEQLDWQKAFIDAQLEQADIFDKIADAIDKVGGALEEVGDLFKGGLGGLTSGDPVDPFKDLETTIKQRLDSAKLVIEQFLNGLFGGEKPSASILHYMGIDEETIKEMELAYEWGKKIFDLFNPKEWGKASGADSPFQDILDFLGGLGGGAIDLLANFTETLTALAKKSGLVNRFTDAMDRLKTLFSDALEGGMLSGVSDALKGFVDWVSGDSITLASGNVLSFSDAMSILGDMLGGAAFLAIENAITDFENLVGALEDLTATQEKIDAFFNGLIQMAFDWGYDLWEQYGEGIKSYAIAALAAVLGIPANMISDFFEPHSPPKEGPLSTIDQWGAGLLKLILDGFLNGDYSPLDGVTTLIKNWFTTSLLPAAKEKWDEFRNGPVKSLSTWWTTHIAPKFDTMWRNMGLWFTDIWGQVQTKWEEFRDAPLAALGNWWEGTIKPFFDNLWKGISGWFTSTLLPLLTGNWNQVGEIAPTQGLAKMDGAVQLPFATTLASILAWFTTNTPTIKTRWETFRDTFKEAFATLPGMVGTMFTSLFYQPQIVEGLSIAYERFNSAGKNFAGEVAGGVTEMTNEVASAMAGIVDAMLVQIDAAIAGVQALSAEIDKLNNKSIDIPGGGGGKNTGEKGGDVSVTPFATGGIIMGPTLALMGERRPEVVLPLADLPSILRSSMPVPTQTMIKLEINNPQVRSDDDIRKLVGEVDKKLNNALRAQQRMRGGR